MTNIVHRTAGLRIAAIAALSVLLAACGEGDADGLSAVSTAPGVTAAEAAEAALDALPDVDDVVITAGSVVDGIAFGDLTIGSPNAPVEIIEYASFSCPHCAAFHVQTMPGVKEKLIDKGIVRFVFRNFVRDAADLTAAKLARCKGPERAFLLTDLFFRQQSTWLTQDYANELSALARRAGMNKTDFETCLGNKDLEKDLVAMRDAGMDMYQISATPTFIINGEKIEGALPLADIIELVNEAS